MGHNWAWSAANWQPQLGIQRDQLSAAPVCTSSHGQTNCKVQPHSLPSAPLEECQFNTISNAHWELEFDSLFAVLSLQAGDAITFSWQFVAAGEEKCYHDNVEVKTACASPMIIAAKAFSANVTQHNFSVVITDVCGNTKFANFSYSADGAKAISEVDYVDPTVLDDGSGTFSTGATTTGTRRTTGVSAAAPVTTAAGLIKSTAAAFVASILLMGLLL